MLMLANSYQMCCFKLITILQISYVYAFCDQKHSSMHDIIPAFRLPHLRGKWQQCEQSMVNISGHLMQ